MFVADEADQTVADLDQLEIDVNMDGITTMISTFVSFSRSKSSKALLSEKLLVASEQFEFRDLANNDP